MSARSVGDVSCVEDTERCGDVKSIGKTSFLRPDRNSKNFFFFFFFAFPPKTLSSRPNVINIRSNLGGLGSIGMDWGPMFIFCLVFGALSD